MEEIDFHSLSDQGLAMLKDKCSSEPHFCALLEYTLELRKRHRSDVEELSRVLLSVVLNKDSEKDGLFLTGKYLYEGQYCRQDKPKGLKMIEKAAAGRHLLALEYLIPIYVSQQLWKNLADVVRALFSIQDNFKDQCRILQLMIEYHEHICGNWCKKYFDTVIEQGYFSDATVDSDDKVLLIGMYIQYCGRDVSVIARNLPDDAEFFTFIGPFFDSLPRSSDDMDIQYFIGYNLVFGISCEKNESAGMKIMSSLQRNGIQRNVMKILEQNSAAFLPAMIADITDEKWIFYVSLIGEIDTGKTCVRKRVCENTFNPVWSPLEPLGTFWHDMELYGKKTRIMFHDHPGNGAYHKVIRGCLKGHKSCVPVCVAIFYEPSRYSEYKLEYWYNMVKEENTLTSIFVVEGKCDRERDERAKERIAAAKQFCAERNLLYLETSAKESIGIDKFVDTLCTLAAVPWLKLHQK